MIALPGWLSNALPGTTSFRSFSVLVEAAGRLESEIKQLSNDEIVSRARGLSLEIQGKKKKLSRTDAPLFLALARESTARTLGLRPFDEQLLASCAILTGHAIEMDTGEGKTLVGALAALGYVLQGRQVHVLSVNDHLAERDATWAAPLFALYGIDSGWVGQKSTQDQRRSVYERDIVYAPVSEIGFDVLRDRFVVSEGERVSPARDVAIIDEADAVMIDEAMVPLVLAGTTGQEAESYEVATRIVAEFVEGEHFTVDAERSNAYLTDAGLDLAERDRGGLNLYDEENLGLLTRITLALHARVLMRRDVDYLVDVGAEGSPESGKIRVINTGRGRVADLQRWPDGLHAAIEAKEGLRLSEVGIVLDSIPVHDLLRRYETLSGMSGTAGAVAADVMEFYEIETGRIGRHKPNRRIDLEERVFVTRDEKRAAIVEEIRLRHETGQPVLVGTQSVSESEDLGGALAGAGIPSRILNAKNDSEEATIIARAGELNAVTISTQMSGRGTDIVLGTPETHESVVALGGLAVIATGRYPSPRLDAQLRGRAGRQGDPGESIVFSSLDDDLVKAMAPEHMIRMVEHSGTSMTQPQRIKVLDSCQAISDGVRMDRQRSTWSYNRAMTRQRETVLRHREQAMTSDVAIEELREVLPEQVELLESATVPARVAEVARSLMLFYLDDQWERHLATLNEIRDGIHLRALAALNPSDEFHRVALMEFDGFFDGVHSLLAARFALLTPGDFEREDAVPDVKRPSSTWTYMVTDDPFGSPGDRSARNLSRVWSKRIQSEE